MHIYYGEGGGQQTSAETADSSTKRTRGMFSLGLPDDINIPTEWGGFSHASTGVRRGIVWRKILDEREIFVF